MPQEQLAIFQEEFETLQNKLASTADSSGRNELLREMRVMLQELDALLAARALHPELPA